MIESAFDLLSNPGARFIVVAALSLTIFTGTLAIILPDRFCGPWLTAMAMMQLGLGGFLILQARLSLDRPSGDIAHALMMFLAAPLVIAGSSALAMRIAAWRVTRGKRP